MGLVTPGGCELPIESINGSLFVQYDGELGDFEPAGLEVGFGGSQDVSCSNTIQQSSAASE